MIDFFKNNWTEVTLAIGGVASFFAGRKTKKNTEQTGELENIKIVREIEKDLLADMRDQIDKLIQTNNVMESIIRRQSLKIRQYEVKYGLLKDE